MCTIILIAYNFRIPTKWQCILLSSKSINIVDRYVLLKAKQTQSDHYLFITLNTRMSWFHLTLVDTSGLGMWNSIAKPILLRGRAIMCWASNWTGSYYSLMLAVWGLIISLRIQRLNQSIPNYKIKNWKLYVQHPHQILILRRSIIKKEKIKGR